MVLLGGQYAKHFSSGKSLKTKIYPCGGMYIYLDVSSEEALLSIALDRPHDYSKQHYNASRDQPSKAAKPWQKLTKRKYPFVLLP